MNIVELKQIILKLAQDILDSDIEILSNMPLKSAGIDSNLIVQLIVAIEEEFNIEFEDEKLTYQTLKSVDTISEYVQQILD